MDAPAPPPPPPPPSSSSSSFSAAHYFPARRRVWQACTNCRARKTRCDAAKPKCSLCMAQDVECIYRDSNQPRIEQNTRILLERIQMLEDPREHTPAAPSRAASNNAGIGIGIGVGVGVENADWGNA
ncbi:C6 finger domain-containing protein [Colletotrichum higginsianum IMI 349063]|uniref:C6 finger domain-containing protein n=1 Tax=Colletotrichum higginsianum (strain IMI 349063) TaxID=759273 RepID=A0A1B7XZS9_COLHI|nr:C6 finger domain-containing protein [Colletotrichum higginsianum IMI 349063]OBR05265.1 C6 finger domain-containing protein [Colletotrichum higginsianum IMI 349063]